MFNVAKQAQILIAEAGLYWEDLEYSPIDGRQRELGFITMSLLGDCDWNSFHVFHWLMCVYQSYL